MKALGAPLLHATGIETLYSFIKENLHWTSKLFQKQRSPDVHCVHCCLMWERFTGQGALVSQLHLALQVSSGVVGQRDPRLVMGSRFVVKPLAGGLGRALGC